MELFGQSSLKILRHGSLEILEATLNTRKVLTTEDGRLRDYRGLAEIIGLSPIMMSRVESNPNHIRTLISIWCSQRDENFTSVQNLVDALESIDRFDVIDDVHTHLEADCIAAQDIGLQTLDDARTNDALTIQDIESIQNGQPLTKFDAIILHGEDYDDTTLAYHLADRMEKIGKKIFLPERDLVAGTIEHAASVSIIEKRCDKAIIIFSPCFLKSSINKLYTDLAQFVGIQRQSAVIIPVMYKRCENLPANLSMITKLSYDPKSSPIMNFYERLYKTFGVNPKTVVKDLLVYPPDLNPSLDSKLPLATAVNPNVNVPGALGLISPPQIETSETENGFTLVSVSSSQLNSIATTFSQLDDGEAREEVSSTGISLEQKLPDVPSHEPGLNNSQASKAKDKKSSSRNPIRKLFSKRSGNSTKSLKQPLLN